MSSYYYSQNSQMNHLSYRGFSYEDVKLLAEKDGQGEAMSEYGSTGLWAAIEWIDNYYDKHNKHLASKHPKTDFEWYGWDKTHSDLVDRSIKGDKKTK